MKTRSAIYHKLIPATLILSHAGALISVNSAALLRRVLPRRFAATVRYQKMPTATAATAASSREVSPRHPTATTATAWVGEAFRTPHASATLPPPIVRGKSATTDPSSAVAEQTIPDFFCLYPTPKTCHSSPIF